MSYESGHYKGVNPFGGIKGDEEYPAWIINESLRVARKAVFVFCRWDNMRGLPAPTSTIVWIKNNWTAGDLEHSYARQWEAILFYPCDEHEFNGRPADTIQIDRVPPTQLLHPTQKPTALVEWILRHNTLPADIILDPFLGSGTTAIAAIRTGRQFIGFEIDPHYCKIAERRIRDEQAKIPIPFDDYKEPEQLIAGGL